MTALATERDTVRLINSGYDGFTSLPVKAGVKIFQGSMVGLDGNGDAEPADVGSTRTVGRARQTVDNTGGADGDLTVEIDFGIFRYANDGSNAVALPAAGDAWVPGGAHILDDQTLDDGTGGGSSLGLVVVTATAASVDVLIHPALQG